MGLIDAQNLGTVTDLVTRVRLGRDRGAGPPLAGAGVFEPAYMTAVEAAGTEAGDNVVLLGGHDLRLARWLAPRCRMLTVLEDLPDARLAALERQLRGEGLENVQCRWWRTGTIPTPQGTADRVISVNYLYRSKSPAQALRDVVFTSHHGCRVVLCEPSTSLDGRTARKYSREAELSMENHRALVAYARSAGLLRRFSREGLEALLAGAGMKEIQHREVLHGLALLATARVEF